jgi:hypothetical protein
VVRGNPRCGTLMKPDNRTWLTWKSTEGVHQRRKHVPVVEKDESSQCEQENDKRNQPPFLFLTKEEQEFSEKLPHGAVFCLIEIPRTLRSLRFILCHPRNPPPTAQRSTSSFSRKETSFSRSGLKEKEDCDACSHGRLSVHSSLICNSSLAKASPRPSIRARRLSIMFFSSFGSYGTGYWPS